MGLFGRSKPTVQDSLVELTPAPKVRTVPIHHPDNRIGQIFLGKYKIKRFLGAGSNAEVYVATDGNDEHNRVVIKRIKDQAAASPRFQQFFDAEVRSMAGFVHPYVVKLLGASRNDPNGACLVLEFVLGSTLETVQRASGRLTVDRMARLLGHLGHALYSAQLIGVAHRDLKPANLMVVDPGTSKESLKVMDFGFAGFTAQPHIQLSELTGEGSIFACGTPAYVSPEMIRGDATDARADIYSVGVIVYEMLTGRLPFEYHDTQRLLMAHVREAAPDFASVGIRDVPLEVERVVQHALSKFPSERPQTMKEMVDRLSHALKRDIWAETAPPANSVNLPNQTAAVVPDNQLCQLAKADGIDERYILSDMFEACLPEKLAAIKLRGFIEDVHGEVVESEPGLIRVRVGLPSSLKKQNSGTGSGVFAFISGVRSMPTRGKEPVEIQLKMQKIDNNRVSVLVAFRPIRPFLPTNPQIWQDRCDSYYELLRKFIMPGG